MFHPAPIGEVPPCASCYYMVLTGTSAPVHRDLSAASDRPQHAVLPWHMTGSTDVGQIIA
jgi:hypothetical protein